MCNTYILHLEQWSKVHSSRGNNCWHTLNEARGIRLVFFASDQGQGQLNAMVAACYWNILLHMIDQQNKYILVVSRALHWWCNQAKKRIEFVGKNLFAIQGIKVKILSSATWTHGVILGLFFILVFCRTLIFENQKKKSYATKWLSALLLSWKRSKIY